MNITHWYLSFSQWGAFTGWEHLRGLFLLCWPRAVPLVCGGSFSPGSSEGQPCRLHGANGCICSGLFGSSVELTRQMIDKLEKSSCDSYGVWLPGHIPQPAVHSGSHLWIQERDVYHFIYCVVTLWYFKENSCDYALMREQVILCGYEEGKSLISISSCNNILFPLPPTQEDYRSGRGERSGFCHSMKKKERKTFEVFCDCTAQMRNSRPT